MAALTDLLRGLNEAQIQAVQFTGAPLLVLAGAGSGKTRVLTSKIAWLIEEKALLPWRILAVTFTNKAAREMRSRVESALGNDLSGMQVCTFHSFGLQMLFRHREWLRERGYNPNFVIYDRNDSLSVIKRVMESLNVDPERIEPSWILEQISRAKEAADPALLDSDLLDGLVGQLFEGYCAALKDQGAFDFDDLIAMPLQMLNADSDLLRQERDRLDWILVDEYQDVNGAQYRLMKKLTGNSPNLMVVGDPDQSIYGWRGADVSTIMNFEKDFPSAKVILLEQNYRSTDKILAASNAVIRHNSNRREKELWTNRSDGGLPQVWQLANERAEALAVAEKIQELAAQGYPYGHMAILYRINAMSRTYEQQLLERGLPYRIVKGTGFYDREEVRDVLAYMRLAVNPWDRAALDRVGNLPPRGLGSKSLDLLDQFIQEHRGPDPFVLWRTVKEEQGGLSGKAGQGAAQLAGHMEALWERQSSLAFVIHWIMTALDYEQILRRRHPDDWPDRYDNIRELQSLAPEGEELSGVLAQVALYTDADSQRDEGANQVSLSSLHAAKGLEFPVVFLVGMEEGIFPHGRSSGNADQLEEERRLCYVGMTRAEEKLFMSGVYSRRIFGTVLKSGISRFIREIPQDLRETVDFRDREEEWGYDRRWSYRRGGRW